MPFKHSIFIGIGMQEREGDLTGYVGRVCSLLLYVSCLSLAALYAERCIALTLTSRHAYTAAVRTPNSMSAARTQPVPVPSPSKHPPAGAVSGHRNHAV